MFDQIAISFSTNRRTLFLSGCLRIISVSKEIGEILLTDRGKLLPLFATATIDLNIKATLF